MSLAALQKKLGFVLVFFTTIQKRLVSPIFVLFLLRGRVCLLCSNLPKYRKNSNTKPRNPSFIFNSYQDFTTTCYLNLFFLLLLLIFLQLNCSFEVSVLYLVLSSKCLSV